MMEPTQEEDEGNREDRDWGEAMPTQKNPAIQKDRRMTR